MTNPYNIVSIADEAYAQHAAVMLTSLFETNREKSFRVFLMTYTFSEQTKERLCELCTRYKAELSIIEDDYQHTGIMLLKSETSTKAWNTIMYLKILIPQYLPEDVNRFLFLDVDMIVNADIQPLYEVMERTNSYVIYACEDYKFLKAHKDRLGLREEDIYVNSGVMMVDLKAWRIMEGERPMIDFLKDYVDVLNNDQDAFALYFRGKIGLLPTSQWNATTFFFEQEPRVLDKYLPEVETVRKNPYIIHFCEPVKPWFRECLHPYRHLYRKFLLKTPWKEYTFPCSGKYTGLQLAKYYMKYWLNATGIREEPMTLVSL